MNFQRLTTTGGRDATEKRVMGNVALSVNHPGVSAPKGWEWFPLTSVARMESGHTPSRKKPEYWGGDISWIGIKDAKRAHGGTVNETLENTNELGINNSSARVLPAGTVCLSRTASVGYVVKMGHDMATSQDFANWVCSDRLDPDFLRYLFVAEGSALSRFSSGSVHQTIYYPELKAFHVCIPPLDEQKRIVAVLDQAFAALDRARAHAEANRESSRELFGTLLEVTLRRDASDWERRSLKSLGTTQTGTTPKASEAESYGDFIPFIKPGDFKLDGSLELENQGLSALGAKKARTVPAGSALMVCIGATIGKAGFTETEIVTNQQINSIFPRDGISGEFLYYQFITPSFQKEVMRRSSQATLPIINKSKWSDIEVSIPSDPAAQLRIVETLREIRRYTEQLFARYDQKLADIANLRQSFLQKAFSGNLT